ncbi:MAG: beta-ketoacyl-ACP synthase [Cyanobacteriota bacterium]|nr:beta-ketoacyl-ACP synthase [Cyanobacteriota bacterium]
MTGLGLVTALGPSRPTTWAALLAGQSALAVQQPFADLPARPLALVGQTPTTLLSLLQPAVREALEDAGLVPPLPDCGVVIGSSRSFQGALEASAQAWLRQHHLLDRHDWLNALPSQPAIATAQQIGATGPLLAPMAACATGLWAVFQGSELIRSGQCDRVLVGAAEAPITPLTLTGFEQLGALAPQGCYPFSEQRLGLALGEGAAVLMLESESSVRQRSGVKPYGRILAAGLRADAYHITAPAPDQGASRSALLACLHRSGLLASAIDYVHAHGTGTRLNDGHEAKLVSTLLPHQPPLSSTKGATGHTLGASGAIGVSFCCLALRHQQLPPNTGLHGNSIYPALVGVTQSVPVRTALCLGFGFGGQNAALAIGQP